MEMNKKDIVIVGAGIAGLEAATQLSDLGYNVIVIEKKKVTGGHVNEWFKTFPYFDASEKIVDFSRRNHENISLVTETQLTYAERNENGFKLHTDKNKHIQADAILLASGFRMFDAHRKEEYGYGIFPNVMTNEDLEKIFSNGWPADWKTPARIGFIHCVGSRDAKIGNLYCSKVCCATAVKQAIEIRQMFPNSEVYCFYMDLRMFGMNYEEMFQMAQEKYGIHFVRARLSEVNQTIENELLIKVEDTLTSRPMKLTLDYIVLMSGMEPGKNSAHLSQIFGVAVDENGFFLPSGYLISENTTSVDGVFLAGAATGPKTITESINDARSAALTIHNYLKKL
jgi:heterodisulfide reductase subunit A2